MSGGRKKLGELRPGTCARISRVGDGCGVDLARRLLEMGLLEGAEVEVLHEAPFGGDPIAIRVRGSVVALRRGEANAIEVEIS